MFLKFRTELRMKFAECWTSKEKGFIGKLLYMNFTSNKALSKVHDFGKPRSEPTRPQTANQDSQKHIGWLPSSQPRFKGSPELFKGALFGPWLALRELFCQRSLQSDILAYLGVTCNCKWHDNQDKFAKKIILWLFKTLSYLSWPHNCWDVEFGTVGQIWHLGGFVQVLGYSMIGLLRFLWFYFLVSIFLSPSLTFSLLPCGWQSVLYEVDFFKARHRWYLATLQKPLSWKGGAAPKRVVLNQRVVVQLWRALLNLRGFLPPTSRSSSAQHLSQLPAAVSQTVANDVALTLGLWHPTQQPPSLSLFSSSSSLSFPPLLLSQQ